MISASKLREKVPADELMGLEEMTSAELAWRGDNHADPERRAWARWELGYRDALGVHVDISPDGRLRRSEVTDAFVQQLEGERAAAAAGHANARALLSIARERAGTPPDPRACQGCGAVQGFDECLACMDKRLGIVRAGAAAV